MHNYKKYDDTIPDNIDEYIIEQKFKLNEKWLSKHVVLHHKKAIFKMLLDNNIKYTILNYNYKRINYKLILISEKLYNYKFILLTKEGMSFLKFYLPRYTKNIALSDFKINSIVIKKG